MKIQGISILPYLVPSQRSTHQVVMQDGAKGAVSSHRVGIHPRAAWRGLQVRPLGGHDPRLLGDDRLRKAGLRGQPRVRPSNLEDRG